MAGKVEAARHPLPGWNIQLSSALGREVGEVGNGILERLRVRRRPVSDAAELRQRGRVGAAIHSLVFDRLPRRLARNGRDDEAQHKQDSAEQTLQ